LKREKQRYLTDQDYRELKIEGTKQRIKERYHNDEVFLIIIFRAASEVGGSKPDQRTLDSEVR
jgi:hypothetical protein